MVIGRRKLLLADDSTAIQKVVSLTFSDEGWDVTTVSTGAQALKYLQENAPPDIVLADCSMPEIGGYELCERIKRDTHWRRIPVLLLVGIFEPFNEAEARRVGADDVVTKPFQSIRDLMSKVGSLLGGSGKDEGEPASTTGSNARAAKAEPKSADDEPRPTWESRHETSTTSRDAGSSSSAPPTDAIPDPASSFADMRMDDQMIEATPAENFGDSQEEKTSDSLTRQPALAENASIHIDVADEASATRGQGQWTGAHEESPAYSPAQQDIGEETLIAQPSDIHEPAVAQSGAQAIFSTQMASAAAADDALLDLGDIEPPPSATEADDFILDLSDETPAHVTASPSQANVSPSAGRWDAHTAASFATETDAAGAFAEAAHGEAIHHAPQALSPTLVETEEGRDSTAKTVEFEYHGQVSEVGEMLDVTSDRNEAVETSAPHEFIEPTVVSAQEEPVPVGMEGSRINRGAEGDVARPPVAESGVESDDVKAGRSVEGQISLSQLSPEVIDAIARRAVEHLSERVVQEIAWEVVPQLAELLIKRRLDEESDRQ